ncbi:MAG: tetratricopeptide repeat protein [Planctomycetaceae bacterium]|nr:tetratricopeptide repeat protein [Planctomycetaceae bacterium]
MSNPSQHAKWGISLALIAAIAGAVLWRTRMEHAANVLEELDRNCHQALEEQDWLRLQENAEEWLSREPDSADACLFLGEARKQRGDLEGAVSAILQVPDGSPKIHPALLIAADLQFGPLNHPLDAVDSLKRLLAVKPQSMAARRRLIFFYGVTLQREEMISQIREAIRHDAEPPESYVYLMIADHLSFTNGFSEAERWLKSAPDSEVFQVARLLQLQDQLENSETPPPEAVRRQAGIALKELIGKYPGNLALARYRLERAAQEFQLDEIPEVFATLSENWKLDSVICRHQGWYLARTGKPEEAERWFRESLDLFPFDWHAWHELAGILRRLGDLAEAERAAEIALEGKELRKKLVQLPTASDIPTELLKEVGDFAKRVGANAIARQADLRVSQPQAL